MEFHEADPQAEAVLEHGLQVLETDAVDDMLVYRPAFEAVLVLVSPSVPLRQEGLLAVLALVALGFKQNDAYESVRAALTLLGADATVESVVRACLKKGG